MSIRIVGLLFQQLDTFGHSCGFSNNHEIWHAIDQSDVEQKPHIILVVDVLVRSLQGSALQLELEVLR